MTFANIDSFIILRKKKISPNYCCKPQEAPLFGALYKIQVKMNNRGNIIQLLLSFRYNHTEIKTDMFAYNSITHKLVFIKAYIYN